LSQEGLLEGSHDSISSRSSRSQFRPGRWRSWGPRASDAGAVPTLQRSQ